MNTLLTSEDIALAINPNSRTVHAASPAELAEKHGPLPGGQAVEAERVQRNGGNIHQIATEITVREVDETELPPAVRSARKKLEKIEATKAAADAELNQQIQGWAAYQRLLDEIKSEQQHHGSLVYILNGCNDRIAGFDAEFALTADNVRREPRAVLGLFQACTELAAARDVSERLPAIITAKEARIAELQAQAGALRDKYDFQ